LSAKHINEGERGGKGVRQVLLVRDTGQPLSPKRKEGERKRGGRASILRGEKKGEKGKLFLVDITTRSRERWAGLMMDRGEKERRTLSNVIPIRGRVRGVLRNRRLEKERSDRKMRVISDGVKKEKRGKKVASSFWCTAKGRKIQASSHTIPLKLHMVSKQSCRGSETPACRTDMKSGGKEGGRVPVIQPVL